MITETLNEVTRKVYVLDAASYHQLFNNPYVNDLFYQRYVLEAPYNKKESFGEFAPVVEQLLAKPEVKVPFFMFKGILILMYERDLLVTYLYPTLKDFNVYKWEYSEESFFVLYNS